MAVHTCCLPSRDCWVLKQSRASLIGPKYSGCCKLLIKPRLSLLNSYRQNLLYTRTVESKVWKLGLEKCSFDSLGNLYCRGELCRLLKVFPSTHTAFVNHTYFPSKEFTILVFFISRFVWVVALCSIVLFLFRSFSLFYLKFFLPLYQPIFSNLNLSHHVSYCSVI